MKVYARYAPINNDRVYGGGHILTMVVCLSTCCWAELSPSASDFMLALNQWPLERCYYWTYTYSFSALNHSESSSWSRSFPHLAERGDQEIAAIGLDVCSLWKLPIRRISRYEKYTIKAFEISIIIMSCLLSLVARVSFHTRKSRGSLWRERIKLSRIWNEFTLLHSDSRHRYLTVLYLSYTCISTATTAESNTFGMQLMLIHTLIWLFSS